jgi:hypothetical protein
MGNGDAGEEPSIRGVGAPAHVARSTVIQQLNVPEPETLARDKPGTLPIPGKQQDYNLCLLTA